MMLRWLRLRPLREPAATAFRNWPTKRSPTCLRSTGNLSASKRRSKKASSARNVRRLQKVCGLSIESRQWTIRFRWAKSQESKKPTWHKTASQKGDSLVRSYCRLKPPIFPERERRGNRPRAKFAKSIKFNVLHTCGTVEPFHIILCDCPSVSALSAGSTPASHLKADAACFFDDTLGDHQTERSMLPTEG